MQPEGRFSSAARRGAAFIALIAFVTLATRLYLRVQQSDDVLSALSYMSQYFTILTNLITLVMMVWIGLGLDLSHRLVKAICLAIVLVGLVYHALLAHLVLLSGIDLWADHGTHTFVPILSGLWWIFLAPKPKFLWSEVLMWIVWPVTYCVYILARANVSGFYPYPFLNLPEIGWYRLLLSVSGLLAAFIGVGLLMTLLGYAGRRVGSARSQP